MESNTNDMDDIENRISSPEELGRFIESGESAHGMLDGNDAIPVDLERLRAYHSGEMSAYDKQVIANLVSQYRDWSEASLRIQRESLRNENMT